MYLHEFIVDRGDCMNDKYSRIFLLCNAIVPIIIGTMIYCLIAPDVYFVEKIDSLLNTCISTYHIDAHFQYIKFIRNYLPDMVWGYSLVSVNGFMVDSTMSEDVVSGKKAMGAVQFYSSDLEENSIEDITDVELYFHIFDEDLWNTVFDSDVITISF
jgi:hypothetical protein